jgi:hypothetical protein
LPRRAFAPRENSETVKAAPPVGIFTDRLSPRRDGNAGGRRRCAQIARRPHALKGISALSCALMMTGPR